MRTTLGLAALLLVAPAVHAVDIDSCGQAVPEKQVGILTADLDCTARGRCHADDTIECDTAADCVAVGGSCRLDPAIVLGRAATLQLNGHRILLHPGRDGIDCEASKRCTVEGPGSIEGGHFAVSGGSAIRGVKLTVVGLDILGAAQGIAGFRAKVDATNVRILDGQVGIAGTKVRATDVEVSGHDLFGIVNVSGLVRVTRLVATGNDVGILGRAIGLTDSTVTGNGVDLQCFRRPALHGTSTCNTSERYVGGGTWGVCTAD